MKHLFCIIGCLLLSVVLLVWALPREGKVAADYQQGRPWKYAPLIAPFDIPIVKTDAEIKAGRDSVSRSFQPYYRLDSLAGEQRVEAFQHDYMTSLVVTVPKAYADYVAGMLRHVYAAGVVKPENLHRMQESGTSAVRVVQNTVARQRQLTAIYSTATAYNLIMKGDSAYSDHDILARCNVQNYLVANLTPDEDMSKSELAGMLDSVAANSGMILAGQRIIDRGEIITAEQQKMIYSYEKANEKNEDSRADFWKKLTGQTFLVTLLLLVFVFYLRMFRPDYAKNCHMVALFFFLIVLFPLLAYLMVQRNFFSVYVLPFAMVPFFVRIFFDSRTASVALIVSMLLVSVGLREQYEFVMLEIFTGLVTLYSLREMTERSQIIRVAGSIALSGLLFQFAYDLSQGLSLADLDRSRYICIVISGIALLFAYPLMYLVERVFGFTSSVALVELSNVNTPLLQRMSKVAQGTFQHSLQVGNLAAEVAAKIGGQTQLVRTAGLYHDIGKMLNPAFFTENQSGVNPHDELVEKDGISPEQQSAGIIISHVTEGLRLAEKHHLPRVLREFIATHHGLSKTKYFYVQWKNNHPGMEPDDAAFTYPGPNPFTKEQAILMMCDAVEAASRSMKEYTEESIAAMVNRIIDGQEADGYFHECPITYRDLQDAKRVLIDALKTVYHTRIAYPELKKTPTTTTGRRKRGHLLSGGFYRGTQD